MTEPPSARGLSLGIDTGGTFTDAVLYDHGGRTVVATKKTPTRHDDLLGCVAASMTAVLEGHEVSEVGLVAVSTTLATNALVEGATRPAALVSIGFEADALARVGLGSGSGSLADVPVVALEGGHGAHGDERGPLDSHLLGREVERIDSGVEAYAVAAHFGVRNTAHELAARQVIAERSGKPVTCSHELSPRLGGPRRALTTLLNAQLISVTASFTEAIRGAMRALGLAAPLMVVRGDGSLVDADFVAQRPIETVLSGPAASVVGALHLAAADLEGESAGRADLGHPGLGAAPNCLVADIGGTTTDIAAIRDGAAVPAGGSGAGTDPGTATVGGHATMVTAMPTLTVGLGGDSQISIPNEGRPGDLTVGPRRAIPLCTAALRHRDLVLEMLSRQLKADRPLAEYGQLLVLVNRPEDEGPDDEDSGAPERTAALAEPNGGLESQVLRLIEESNGALPLSELQRSARWRGAVRALERRSLIRRSTVTPTDACMVLGLIAGDFKGDAEAARMGLELFSRQRDRYGAHIGSGAADMARRILRTALRDAADVLVGVALSGDGIGAAESKRPVAKAALDRRVAELARTAVGDDRSGARSSSDPGAPLWGLLEAAESTAIPVADSAAEPGGSPTSVAGATASNGAARLARVDAAIAVPLVAIGAPAATYAPLVATLAGTQAVVPTHAEVANAVGAAVALVRITKQVTVTAPRRGSYKAHWGHDPPTWHDLDEAREWATAQATEAARAEAAAAGAPDAEVSVDWQARSAPVGDREMFVEATLTVVAAGRPSSA